MLTLRTLGEVQVLSGGEAVRLARLREFALLVYVGCNGERTLTRAHLADMFWPRSSGAHGLHSLSQAMYRLGTRLPGLAFRADARSVAVDPRTLSVDLLEFHKAVKAGAYERAGELYSGPFLDGFILDEAPDFESWLGQTRAEVALAAEDVFRKVLGLAENAGDWAKAEDTARELLRLNPYDEEAAATEIALLAARGERARATDRQRQVEAALRSAGHRPSARLLNAMRGAPGQ